MWLQHYLEATRQEIDDSHVRRRIAIDCSNTQDDIELVTLFDALKRLARIVTNSRTISKPLVMPFVGKLRSNPV